MSVPIQSPPPPDPQAPIAPAGVTVIPTTAAQVKRTASYAWVSSIGLAIPGILLLLVQIAPQLKVTFPKYAETIGALSLIAAAIAQSLTASQRRNSASDAATVNFTPPGG